MRALACEIQEAHKETVRRLAKARAHWARCPRRCPDPSEMGRIAELAYAAHAGLAVWQCLPRWVRSAIHGGPGRTIRDRGVVAVGMRDARLVLAQVKWYRDSGLICSDASMKLALIAAVAQRSLRLAEPPQMILAFRRGARTARSSPGTESVQYVALSDAEIGMDLIASAGPDRAASTAKPADDAKVAADDDPFDAYRYQARRGRAPVPQRQK